MSEDPKTVLPPEPGSTATMAADSQPVARADSVPKARDTAKESRNRRMLRPFRR
jgi:hypothetical protein